MVHNLIPNRRANTIYFYISIQTPVHTILAQIKKIRLNNASIRKKKSQDIVACIHVWKIRKVHTFPYKEMPILGAN